MQIKDRDGLPMRAHAITWSMITVAISISLLFAYGKCGEYTPLGLTNSRTGGDALHMARVQVLEQVPVAVQVARLSHQVARLSHPPDTRRRLLEDEEEAPAEEEEDETGGERQEERGEREDEVAGLSHVSAISARFEKESFLLPTRVPPVDKAKELEEAATLLEEEEEAEGGDFGLLGVWSRRESNGTEGNGTSTGNESSAGNETNTGGNETTTKEALPQGNVTITLYIGMPYAPADFTDGLKSRFKVAVGSLSTMSPAQIVLNVTAPNPKTKPKRGATAPLSIVEARIYGGNPATITQALGSSAALLVKLNKALAEQSISPATGVETQNDITHTHTPHMHIHVNIHIHIHTVKLYTQTHTRTHTHTHTHTHTQV